MSQPKCLEPAKNVPFERVDLELRLCFVEKRNDAPSGGQQHRHFQRFFSLKSERMKFRRRSDSAVSLSSVLICLSADARISSATRSIICVAPRDLIGWIARSFPPPAAHWPTWHADWSTRPRPDSPTSRSAGSAHVGDSQRGSLLLTSVSMHNEKPTGSEQNSKFKKNLRKKRINPLEKK